MQSSNPKARAWDAVVGGTSVAVIRAEARRAGR
jgi:hypothetical protein